ncbi:MAG: DNA repair protein [Clostridia bacterium]|nr:DNA repair protein [Clostridia bacterium]
MAARTYLCIDLKSFYASVECVERGLDPMTAKLVVADPERSEKTICLAVSPALKALGVRNRCRVFEIPKTISYIMATPRMQKYIDYAAEIYGIYLNFIAKEDIHVYSIDEAFLDVTSYLPLYGCTAKEMAVKLMEAVACKVGVRATCGIGTNLYLAKIALDITAKHAPDFIGVLDEQSYRETLWAHTPLTDFWRIGAGTARRLEELGIYTMGELARADEERLYRTFGIDAELLIDHAWGREPVTIADIKAYKPKTSCLTSGQVLMRDYTFEEGRLIAREMADAMCLDMVDKSLVASSVSLMVGYSNALHAPFAKGSTKLARATNADSVILPAVTALYERIVEHDKPVRRMYLICNNVMPDAGLVQTSLFDAGDNVGLIRSRKMQKAVLGIKKKYGKNAMLRGMDLEEAATAQERNKQIGGHKSGE